MGPFLTWSVSLTNRYGYPLRKAGPDLERGTTDEGGLLEEDEALAGTMATAGGEEEGAGGEEAMAVRRGRMGMALIGRMKRQKALWTAGHRIGEGVT